MPSKHFDPMAEAEAGTTTSQSEEETPSLHQEGLEWISLQSVPERRRIYALMTLRKKTAELQRRLHEELAQMELEKREKFRELERKRNEIVQGTRDVTEEEVASLPPLPIPENSQKEEKGKGKGVLAITPEEEKEKAALQAAAESPTGGIPNFWLTCFLHSETTTSIIETHDRPILSYLQRVSTEFIDNDPLKGSKLLFTFEENPYLSTEEGPLTLTVHMDLDEHEGELMVSDLEGCEIHWKSDKMNPTITMEKRKQRNNKTKQMRVIERKVPRPSFFNIFKVSPKKDEEDDEEDEDEMNQLEMNVAASVEILEDIVPNAAMYYSGQASLSFENFFSDDDGELDEEEEEEEEEDEEKVPKFKKAKKVPGKAPSFSVNEMLNSKMSGGQPNGTAPECKQQ